MMSIELLFDPATDAAVRSEWTALADAGLPSQARHTGESNAPHVTLLAARRVAVPPAPPGLPLPLTVGALVVFGAPPRGLVLARLVVVTGALLGVHARVHTVASDVVGPSSFTDPGGWTPHLTLARRLSPAQVAVALDTLETGSARSATAVAVRHWNGDTRVVTPLRPDVGG